jgi:SPP1 gp7 family putative phage head morphogenesis protein
MPRVTPEERRRAQRQAREIARFERKSAEAATRLGAHMMSRSLAAYRTGRAADIPGIVAVEFAKVLPIVVDLMTVAYLTGLDRIRVARRDAPVVAARRPMHGRALAALFRRLAVDPGRLAELTAAQEIQAVRMLRRVEDGVEKKLQRAMLRATLEGLTVREGTKALREAFAAAGVVPVNSFEIEAVFRTQTNFAYSAGSWAAAQDPVVDDILWGFKLVTTGDDRVRDEHYALDGMTAPKDDPIWNEIWPPNGWACFLPGTQIVGDPAWISKAVYSGEAVEINTVNGNRLRVTANHPIATERGWVAAKTLKHGDYVFADRGKTKFVRLSGSPMTTRRTVCNDQRPMRIEDVFKTFRTHGARTAQVSALDFHGDAAFTRGQIDVVCANRKLMEQLDSALPRHSLSDLSLTRPNLDLPLESRLRGSDLFGDGLLPSGAGLPGAFALPHNSTTVVLHPRPFQPFRFGTVPNFHSVATKEQDQSSPADPKIIRDLLRRVPADIARDRVSHVRHFDFSGHVYDLQTQDGYIIADGIVSSNCRCQVIFVYDEREKALPEPEVEIDGRTVIPGPDKGFAFNPGTLLRPGGASVRLPEAVGTKARA